MDTVYISFCLLSKNTISGKLYDKKSLCLLGYDYRDCLEMLENRMTLPNIETFGKMMSDGRRIEILEYLITYGELSTTEIAQKCLQTVNAVFYHLDMMYQADVLHSRNAGRAVIYRVNYKYFEIMRELLRKYTKKGKE
jgi:DNA-binding transcriptional ArsR family regulator